MKKSIIFALTVILVSFFGVCIFSPEDDGKTIYIGSIIPLTGYSSHVGQCMQIGMEMAAEDFNQKSDNKQLSILYEDSRCSPITAVEAYQKMKSSKDMQFFVSTVSSVCSVLKPLVCKDSKLLFVNAGHKDLVSKDYPLVFRNALTSSQEAGFLTEQLKKDSSITGNAGIAVLYTNDGIGIEFKEAFVDNYGAHSPITNMVAYEESEHRLKDVVSSLLDDSPQVVVISGSANLIGRSITAIREQGFKGKIYASQGSPLLSAYENVGVFGNNVFYTDYDFPENEEMASLRKRLKEKYNQDLSSEIFSSYVIVTLLGKAIKSVGTNLTEIVTYLNNNGPFEIKGMQITIDDGEVYVPLKLVENDCN